MDIYDKVLNYIQKYNLINNNDKIICAVSGGADSSCMLHILASLADIFSLKLYVAHLNHQLRGEDADRDEDFVRNLAQKYGLEFFCKRVDVNQLSKQLKTSCEEAGRVARYFFFKDLKKQLNADKIATAHNKNDNVETVLMRLFRGTDLKGLTGIPVQNNISVIRPLLCIERREIEDFIKCKGLEFVTDSTNAEDIYTRNKIRNTFIPEIESEFNNNFLNVFSSNIELFCEANNYIEKKVDDVYAQLVSVDEDIISFSAPLLMTHDSYIVKRIIKKTVFNLCNCNISNEVCNLIYKTLSNSVSSSVTINKNALFYIKYDRAFFVKNRITEEFSYKITSEGMYNIPECGILFEVVYGEGKTDFSNKNVLYLDADRVNCNFTLRSRRPGDKINLSGCGTKKIKDILIDGKIPVFQRNKFPVLEYNNEIIWLCGIRDNASYRAKSAKSYIKLSIHKEKKNEQ